MAVSADFSFYLRSRGSSRRVWTHLPVIPSGSRMLIHASSRASLGGRHSMFELSKKRGKGAGPSKGSSSHVPQGVCPKSEEQGLGESKLSKSQIGPSDGPRSPFLSGSRMAISSKSGEVVLAAMGVTVFSWLTDATGSVFTVRICFVGRSIDISLASWSRLLQFISASRSSTWWAGYAMWGVTFCSAWRSTYRFMSKLVTAWIIRGKGWISHFKAHFTKWPTVYPPYH